MVSFVESCPIVLLRQFSVMTFEGRYSNSPDILLVTLVTTRAEYTYIGDGDSFAYWQGIAASVYARVHEYGCVQDYPMCDDTANGEYSIHYFPLR